jgi:hypothetical protein
MRVTREKLETQAHRYSLLHAGQKKGLLDAWAENT